MIRGDGGEREDRPTPSLFHESNKAKPHIKQQKKKELPCGGTRTPGTAAVS